MKILDTAMTEIVKGNSARYYSKYVVEGKEYTETLNNFKFQNIINPNNEITIGNTCSSGVTFSIYMPTISLENKEITIFEGVKVGAEIKYIKLGIFTVTKQTSDGEYTSYEAYDRMYKADMPYFSDMAFPSTDKAILNEICGKLGISLATNIATVHIINDKPQGYTMREIIGYMAMLQGCNAVINSDGNLELRWYKDSGYVLDGHKYYQQGVSHLARMESLQRSIYIKALRLSLRVDGRQAIIPTRTDRKFALMIALSKDTSSAKAVLISRVVTMELWAVMLVQTALCQFQMV